MTKLEKAIIILRRMEMRGDEVSRLDPRVAVAVSVVYLCMMLSVGVGRLSALIWFAIYPVVASAWLGIPFSRIFRNSLIVLPLVILIGMFNPIYDRTPAMTVGSVIVSRGWISFISIILRGLFAMQCVLILIESNGFLGICRGLRRLGIPDFLTDQLQFIYRYLTILLNEAETMRRARESRGYGRESYPIRIWGMMIGQLFIRAVDRSERIGRAMLARGFDGSLPDYRTYEKGIRRFDIIFLIVWVIVIVAMRLLPFSSIFQTM